MMKSLQDMSLDELWQLFPVTLVEYNPLYPSWYEQEKLWLEEHLSHLDLQRMNHIGSSSVSGLDGKPTVDILIEFSEDNDTNAVHEILSEAGWLLMSESSTIRGASYCKGYTPQGLAEQSFHLHVRPFDDWDELYFRDYLRSHAEAAAEYVALKQQLQERFKHDRDTYTEAKTDFCTHICNAARTEFPDRYAQRVS